MTACNQFKSGTGDGKNKEFDEETWLVSPPSVGLGENSQHPGRIVEWLQGASLNVDFQTRSALSRKLAHIAAKRKRRAEKFSMEKKECRSDVFLSANKSIGEDISHPRISDNRCVFDKIQENVNDVNDNIENVCGKMEKLELANTTDAMRNRSRSLSLSSSDSDEFYDAFSDFEELANNYVDFQCGGGEGAKNETRSVEKMKISSNLETLSESAEAVYVDPKITTTCSTSGSFTMEDRLPRERRNSQNRAAYTARVAPIVMKSPQTPAMSFRAHKSDSLAGPDLIDIQHIVELQETELREEMRQRKTSLDSEGGRRSGSSKNTSNDANLLTKSMRSPNMIASSRSVDFSANNSPVYSVQTSSKKPSVSHISRLPTPVRRVHRLPALCTAIRYTSRLPAPQMSARGLAGGSTPSLVIPNNQMLDDSLSEYGGSARYERQWCDEYF